MKKTTLPALPHVAELTAGLDLETVHPRLSDRIRERMAADLDMERAQDHLTACEVEVRTLPERIQRGDAPASALREAMRSRDAAAMMIAPADAAVERAVDLEVKEREIAKKAKAKEIKKRLAQLESAAESVSAYLEKLKELDLALSRCEHKEAVGYRSIAWPISWATQVYYHGVVRSLDPGLRNAKK